MGAQDLFGKLKEGMDPGFRLFITALPNDEFPLGLLQMCTKVCVGSRKVEEPALVTLVPPGATVDAQFVTGYTTSA